METSPNTQLPAEVLEDINNKAEAYANKYLNGKVNTREFAIIEDTYNACATEYATKLHQAQQEIESKLHDADKKIRSFSSALATQKRSYERISADYEALQAKCDMYEKVMKQIIPYLSAPGTNGNHWVPVINEALSGEGDKLTPKQIAERTDAINWYRNPDGEKEAEKQWWEGKAIEDMPEYVKVIREDCSKETGLYCKVHKWSAIDNIFPELKGQLGAELIGYEPDYLVRTEFNFPGQVYGRLNATHLLPATKEEYEAYLQITNPLNDGQ